MAGEVSIAREQRAKPINAVSSGNRNRNVIPENEREATEWWIKRAQDATTEERVSSITRTVESIFNQGGVSYASAKAVIDAAEKRAKELKGR